MQARPIAQALAAPLLIALTFCLSGPAQAMTPGADKTAWDPEAIAQLTPQQAKALRAAHCRVVSYRNMDSDQYRPNTSGKPDGQDELMLAPGEFAKPGQKDLLALCVQAEAQPAAKQAAGQQPSGGQPGAGQAGAGGAEFFFVVWGGSAQCASTLMLDTVSRYWKSRDSNLDYYGSRLEVMPPDKLREFLTQRAGEPAHRESEMGDASTWVMKKEKWPAFNHDAFTLFGNYSLIYYCNGKSWVPLYDSYSTEID